MECIGCTATFLGASEILTTVLSMKKIELDEGDVR